MAMADIGVVAIIIMAEVAIEVVIIITGKHTGVVLFNRPPFVFIRRLVVLLFHYSALALLF